METKTKKIEKSELSENREKAEIVQLDETSIRINNHPYKIIENYRDGFDKEKLAERYSEVLKKYDYIVADWGYEQLRLKGFYNRNYSRSKIDQRIDYVEDYLLEYCNFGCSYFILENLRKMPKAKLNNTKVYKNNRNKTAKKPVTTTKNKPTGKNKNNKKPVNSGNQNKQVNKVNNKKTSTTKKRNFRIRKKDEK